jgi:putative DNA primase/helicase
MTEPSGPFESRTVRPADALEEQATELGPARRFVRLVGQDFRFVPATRTWLTWVETHWAQAQGGEVERAAKQVVESLWAEVATETDPDRQRSLAKFALAAQSARVIRNMLAVAETELGIALSSDALDRDPMLLNCLNGTLDLITATLRPHRREDLISRMVRVAFDPAASSPTFEAFLDRIFVGRGRSSASSNAPQAMRSRATCASSVSFCSTARGPTARPHWWAHS